MAVIRNSEGRLHCLDGPAVIYKDRTEEYWIDGKIPTSILDLIIIPEEIDFETFPSATLAPEIKYWNYRHHRAYRLSDPDELTLAILRHG